MPASIRQSVKASRWIARVLQQQLRSGRIDRCVVELHANDPLAVQSDTDGRSRLFEQPRVPVPLHPLDEQQQERCENDRQNTPADGGSPRDPAGRLRDQTWQDCSPPGGIECGRVPPKQPNSSRAGCSRRLTVGSREIQPRQSGLRADSCAIHRGRGRWAASGLLHRPVPATGDATRRILRHERQQPPASLGRQTLFQPLDHRFASAR